MDLSNRYRNNQIRMHSSSLSNVAKDEDMGFEVVISGINETQQPNIYLSSGNTTG